MGALLKKSLSYVILPGRPPLDFAHRQWHDRAFRFWKTFWTEILKENRTAEHVRVADFFRQDCVTLLVHDEEVIAMHTYTFFDLTLAGTKEHEYFERYSQKFLQDLRRRRVSRVMTMEFFSVARQWRGSQVGVSLASVLAGLGLRIAKEAGVDATISVARADIGAAKIGHDFGAVSLDTKVMVYNTPCDLVAFLPEKLHPHPDPVVNDLVDHFWRVRLDLISASAARPKAA